MGKQYYKRTRGTWRRPQSGNAHRLIENNTKNISNCKNASHDRIDGFWFKKFTSIHSRLALDRNRCQLGAQIPDWMTKGNTALIQMDSNKGTALNNCGTITCLPTMWKILTAQIREQIYYSLTSSRLFPDEQKRCRKGSRGRAELLYIDQHILNEGRQDGKI